MQRTNAGDALRPQDSLKSFSMQGDKKPTSIYHRLCIKNFLQFLNSTRESFAHVTK